MFTLPGEPLKVGVGREETTLAGLDRAAEDAGAAMLVDVLGVVGVGGAEAGRRQLLAANSAFSFSFSAKIFRMRRSLSSKGSCIEEIYT